MLQTKPAILDESESEVNSFLTQDVSEGGVGADVGVEEFQGGSFRLRHSFIDRKPKREEFRVPSTVITAAGRNISLAIALSATVYLHFQVLQLSATIAASASDMAPQAHSLLRAPSQRIDDGCLSVDQDLQDMVASSDQVIVAMPAKAAGTTMKVFARSCNDKSHGSLPDNFINRQEYLESILTNSLEAPGVLASHVNTGAKSLTRLIRNIPRKTLLVYSHREETSRLLSAIKQVATRVCKDIWVHDMCNIKESRLVDIIKSKQNEIGVGSTKILTCETYQAIKDYRPSMVWMDYKRADHLQSLLAQKFCPSLVGQHVQRNVADEKNDQIYISSDDFNVTLTEWLKNKSSTLEWSLGLNEGGTCTAKTRDMEDELFSCGGGFMNATIIGARV